MVGELSDPALTERKTKGRKTGPDLGVLIDTTVVGLFGLAAVATGHEHWLKEREHVIPITGPLKAWVDQLPSKTLKRLEEKLAPTLLVVGLATVVGPDVIAEVKLRAYERSQAALSKPSRNRQVYPDSPTGDTGSTTNGVGGHKGSSAGAWVNSIPATAPIGSDFDV